MLRNPLKKRHSQNTLEAIHAAFPSALSDDVSEVMKHIPTADIEPHTDHAYRVNESDGEVTIPCRVYFPEIQPGSFRTHSDTQCAILAAILTRHHSGYQRETWAEQLTGHPKPWTAPFLAILLGDYVKEIPALLERTMGNEWTQLIQEFAAANPEWRRPLNHRILTYWDIYYRRQIPRLTDYPGYRLAHRLELWDKKTAPKLTRVNKRMESKG